MWVRIYTDGACSGNPGPGGWAWATVDGKTGAGHAADTTNQRMELMAVLEAVTTIDGPIDIYSDSTYVVKCFNDKWYKGWLDRGWKNSQKKPVANRDIWEPLIEEYLRDPERLRFFWVKGHSGDEMNDLVDALAVAEVEKLKASASNKPAYDDIDVPWPLERAVSVIGERVKDQTAANSSIDQLNNDSIVVSGLRRGLELELAERTIETGRQLAVVLPFGNPVTHWSATDQARFDRALKGADWVVELPGNKADLVSALRDRNEWIRRCALAVITNDRDVASTFDNAGVSAIQV